MSTATADRATRGYGLAHDEGEAFWLLGMLQTVKIGRADTDGSVRSARDRRPARARIPVACAPRRGRVVLRARGEPHVLRRRHAPGSDGGRVRVRPQGRAAHVHWRRSDPTRALVGFAPMQFEGFLREVGHPAPARVLPPPLTGPPPELENLAPIAKRNGLIILGPPGPPPGR